MRSGPVFKYGFSKDLSFRNSNYSLHVCVVTVPSVLFSLSNLRIFKIHGNKQKVRSVLFKMHPA